MTTNPLANSMTIPATMRAAVMTGLRRVEIQEKPTPRPGLGEVLVRLRAIGICGSDVHYYLDGRIGDAVVEFPYLLGHEPAGEIAALGDGVTGLAVGQRVALEPAKSCGACHACRIGRPNCCPHVRFLGTPPIDGTFEEYHCYAPEQCVPIPDHVSFEAAATLEPMAVGIHAVNMAPLKLGDRLAIMGCGPIGLVTMMAARAAGASFIAMTDPIPERRAAAQRFGADLVLDPRDGGAVERIAATGPIDIAFDAAGEQAAIDDATLCVRPAGTAVIIGIPAVDRISLWVHPVRRKELTIIMARRSNQALDATIRLMATGQIAPEKIVTHRFPLERVAEGMELVHQYRDGVIKAMIVL
ncbi:MAG TPA: alcohol dehydrogenase catalytic domain-containing protein [Armatimonadota bacterium]|nr:alcohol dehydrogenase catalytic domain-containing protein [Armatimonadota bacterium]